MLILIILTLKLTLTNHTALLSLSYFFSNLERANIANAKIAGFINDTGISEPAYNNALSLFFVGIIIFDVPSNLLNKKIGINIWLPAIMIGWALCSLLQAFVTNAAQLYALRFFLGVFESGFAPIQIYYYTLWYTPNEMSVRSAIAFSFSMTASAFSGLAVSDRLYYILLCKPYVSTSYTKLHVFIITTILSSL